MIGSEDSPSNKNAMRSKKWNPLYYARERTVLMCIEPGTVIENGQHEYVTQVGLSEADYS